MTKLRAQFKELLEQSGLLKKEESSSGDLSKLTSSERAARHGEMKQLRDKKREFLKSEGPRKKKFLKMSDMDDLGGKKQIKKLFPEAGFLNRNLELFSNFGKLLFSSLFGDLH